MITIAWYNVVAIVVGIAFIGFLTWLLNKDTGSGTFAGLAEAFYLLITIMVAIIFFATWGGIFWW